MKSDKLSRRNFLKQAAAISAAAAVAPMMSWAMPVAAPGKAKTRKIGPNEKVNLACIGIGNRGNEIIKAFSKTGLANFVALCDVDMGAAHTTEVLKMFPDAARFQDYRVMFDKMGDQIDAVCIGLPDHAHFPATMLAMSYGKHVYVEKPMARTFNEIELMMKAAKKYKVVTQMGNQGHSDANYFQFKAWKEAGIIKDVYAITAHMNSARRWHGWDTKIKSMPAPQPKPGTIDWDIWVGVSKDFGYNKDYVNGQWRCWYEYGMGALGDWGAHIIDTAHQFLDLGLPYEVDPIKLEGHNPFFYPMSSTLVFKFPERKGMPALDITWYDGVNNIPQVPEGFGVSELDPNIPPTSVGKVQPVKLNPGKEIYSKELIFKGGSHGSTLSIIPEEKAKAMASKLPVVPESTSNHFANFLLACRGDEEARSPFEIAGPLSQVFCLGVMAQRMGTKIKFDRNTKQITNNKEANELLVGAPPRKGWEEFYKL